MVDVVRKAASTNHGFASEVGAMLREEHPADLLQRLPAGLQWAVADAALLLAIDSGQSLERGPRGRALHRLLRLARYLRQEKLLVFLVGLVEVCRHCRRQGRELSDLRLEKRIFVGFGAAAEEALFGQYRDESADSVARLDQTRVGTLGLFHTVGWLEALRTLRLAHRQAFEAAAHLPEKLKPWRLDFLTHAAMQLGHYSYMRAWFAEVRTHAKRLQEVCFLASDTAAFAAVDAGLRTRYLQHGLIRRSLVLPRFDMIDALTVDEQTHFCRRLPGAQVRLSRNSRAPMPAAAGHGVLVASHHETPEEMARIAPLLDWFASCGVPIVVRPHPKEDRAFWRIHGPRWRCAVDDSDGSFMLAVKRLRPRFVVSWYSTALVDALTYGVLPVTVSHAGNPAIEDMVYCLLDRALHWPRDAELLASLLNDDRAYGHALARLRRDGDDQ